MQSHCQHNLYICHCSPSSQDPSPIHPLTATSTHQTTTLHRFPKKKSVQNNQELVKHKYTVSHSSVAVMTSPTLQALNHNGTSGTSENLKDSPSPSTASSCSSVPTTTVMTMHNGNGNSRYSQHLGMIF